MKNPDSHVVPESLEGLSFTSLKLRDALQVNLVSLDYQNMTPIQAESLPIMLDGADIIAQANTGSGKTAAFGLALLNRLNVEHYAIQALVLCPTRELAEQVSQALRRLARLLSNIKILNLSGGMPMRPQLDSLRHGAHIVVGTPGRVQKHLDNESLSLNKLQTLVLDEADRMLDMGFLDSIKKVINFCPKARQTLLFSATYPAQIEQLAGEFMHNPQRVIIENAQSHLDIEQCFYEVSHKNDKFPLLKSLLLHYRPTATLIFCNTKDQTVSLSGLLCNEGFSAIALNGDLEQIERDEAMIRFSNRSALILVATDVAARGLDIKDLPTVINYDVAFEPEVHIHRIGRTGRAGSKGLALTLTTPADAERLCVIEQETRVSLAWGDKSKLDPINTSVKLPDMVTLCIAAGRKEKIRPGDILGALTKDAGLPGDNIGKIDVSTLYSYVAIRRSQADKAYKYLQNGKLKGRKVNVRRLLP
ncbi:ATP-dependent RNA helicase DbpA [Legionella spiritensis]|uniref:ATP-dependent RNA helicase DbpA n=1 Tax=Legionella spiritensis TaxID=452 RepID=A0A0W0Z534_LEGSP|nr:ATP-dependent RNA helicase DbpA [Legionella spiritensis]KTD64272.1 ATP-dependent RNA helicase DbpA [Legionella spiritensis]SNV46989.1 ATP dependent RNA helicase DbpA [Legionella spiritensis]